MKIRAISETQAQRCWSRLIELQQHGYVYLIKRGGKTVARLERTISRGPQGKTH